MIHNRKVTKEMRVPPHAINYYPPEQEHTTDTLAGTEQAQTGCQEGKSRHKS